MRFRSLDALLARRYRLARALTETDAAIAKLSKDDDTELGLSDRLRLMLRVAKGPLRQFDLADIIEARPCRNSKHSSPYDPRIRKHVYATLEVMVKKKYGVKKVGPGLFAYDPATAAQFDWIEVSRA